MNPKYQPPRIESERPLVAELTRGWKGQRREGGGGRGSSYS